MRNTILQLRLEELERRAMRLRGNIHNGIFVTNEEIEELRSEVAELENIIN